MIARADRADRFDRLYTENPDPWDFKTSDYEREKYEATLNALPRDRYRMAIEAGCSIGELTRRLGHCCDAVLGIDVSRVALDVAKARNADRPNISFLRAELPGGWPDLSADLIVLSEVLYFLGADEIRALAAKILPFWEEGGDCLLVNFRGETSEALQGEAAADLFIDAITAPGSARRALTTHTDAYRIDVLRN